MFPQCRFSQPTAKGNWPTSSYSKWYQEPTSLPTRKWRISQKNQYGFEQMLKLLMNLLIFLMGNTFSCVCVCVCVCVCGGGRGGGASNYMLSPNGQNFSLVRTCSILVVISLPLDIQNFTSTLPPSWVFLISLLYIYIFLLKGNSKIWFNYCKAI